MASTAVATLALYRLLRPILHSLANVTEFHVPYVRNLEEERRLFHGGESEIEVGWDGGAP